MLHCLFIQLAASLGTKWADVYFGSVRQQAISSSSLVTGAALALGATLVAITMVKMYYDMAADEKNGGFGGISLWEVLRPIVLMFVIASSSLIVGALDGITSGLSSSMVTAFNADIAVSEKTMDDQVKELKEKRKNEASKRYEIAERRAEQVLGGSKEALEQNIQQLQEDYNVKVKYKTERRGTGEFENVDWWENGYKTTKKVEIKTETSQIKTQKRVVERAIRKTLGGNDDAVQEALDEYYDAVDAYERYDAEVRRQMRLEDRMDSILDSFGSKGVKLVQTIVILLFNIVFNLTMCFADILLCLLAIFFPLVAALSILPSWKGSFLNWFGKYIEVSMWKPVAAAICWIIGTVMKNTTTGALSSVTQAMANVDDPTIGSALGCITAIVIVVYAGVKCMWKVPSITTTIFNLGGGALSDFGSMAGAAAGAAAGAVGNAAKGTAKAAGSVAGGGVAGAIAGATGVQGMNAVKGMGSAVGNTMSRMLGVPSRSGKGFGGAMAQMFSGAENAEARHGSKPSGSGSSGIPGGTPLSSGSAAGGVTSGGGFSPEPSGGGMADMFEGNEGGNPYE